MDVHTNPILGVFYHALGGLAAGSFYIPYKGIKKWSWESAWIVGGVFSWIIAPWVAASLLVPDLMNVLGSSSGKSLFFTYLFGAMWGVGGLTYGLSMRYLGLSLGNAVTLGFCAAFGTLVPPIFFGEFMGLTQSQSGMVTLAGVVVCLMGIATSGRAGFLKERELSEEAKKATLSEFHFFKGLWVATLSGIMSSCMAFAFKAGAIDGGISQTAIAHNTGLVWQNIPVLIVALFGGFTTNFIWCMYLNFKNKSFGDYLTQPMAHNYLFAAVAGTTWYMQFFFYGMGTTYMGKYDFASWTIHMAFIIVFSTLWGLWFLEWRGTSRKAVGLVLTGITVLILSTFVIGAGTYLKKQEDAGKAPASAEAPVATEVAQQ
jgi:L-rhamnose-H+ transport protein